MNKSQEIPTSDKEDAKESLTWNKLTKQQKRATKFLVDGRKVRALDYIDGLAKKLPKMSDKDTNAPINHQRNLRDFFMSKGLDGVNSYRDMIIGEYTKQLKEFDKIRQQERKAELEKAKETTSEEEGVS